jgi:porin
MEVLRNFFALFLVLLMQPQVRSHEPEIDSNKAVIAEASYIGEILSNISGGIHTGTVYLSMGNVSIKFNTRAAHLWKGGSLFINGANTHGMTPSADYVGDYQLISNIEAGDHTFMQELWYKQELGCMEITAGLQDLNIYFANTSNGALFLNSSFGIMPTVSSNVPAPVFPMTSLGVAVKWQISGKSTFLAALFDGSPTDFEENPHNLKWQFNEDDGMLIFGEYQLSTPYSGLPGTFKIGVYFHQHLLAEDDHDTDTDTLYRNNNGFYVIADKVLCKNPNNSRNLSIFLQFGLSPKMLNQNNYFAGFGLNYTGLINRHGNDAIGLAFAHAGLRDNYGDETALELTYKFPIIEHFFAI